MRTRTGGESVFVCAEGAVVPWQNDEVYCPVKRVCLCVNYTNVRGLSLSALKGVPGS